MNCGRLSGLTKTVTPAPQGFFAQNPVAKRAAEPVAAVPRPSVEIDERKIVSQIETDTMQKVTQIELGTKTAVADDINVSVNKLAQLKSR
jgi:hypothetical protein